MTVTFFGLRGTQHGPWLFVREPTGQRVETSLMLAFRFDDNGHVGMPEIPPLPEGTILLVEVGSTAHGTGLPGGEDHDEMAVAIEAPADVLGIEDRGYRTVMQRTQPEGSRSGPWDTDRTLHSLRRFVRLAASPETPRSSCPCGHPCSTRPMRVASCRGLGEAFVGRHVIPRYRGYMESQMMRLLGLRGGGHGRRGGGGREELIAEHGYDTKYAMHAARLGFQGVELLMTRRLQLPIAGEPAEWLRAVRRGEVAFDEWMERCSTLDTELERMATDDSKPDGPDRATIERWCVTTHLTHWSAPPPGTN